MPVRARISKFSGQHTIGPNTGRDDLRRTISAMITHDNIREEKGLRRVKRPTPSLPKLKCLEKDDFTT